MPDPDDAGEDQRARLAALREYLLHIVGDEETLEMLLVISAASPLARTLPNPSK